MLPKFQPKKLFVMSTSKHGTVIAIPVTFGAYMSLIDLQSKIEVITPKDLSTVFASTVCRLSDGDTHIDGNELTEEELSEFIEKYVELSPELFTEDNEHIELPRDEHEDIFEYFKRVFTAYMNRRNEHFKSTASIATAKIFGATDLSAAFKNPADMIIGKFNPSKNLNGILKEGASSVALAETFKKTSLISKPETVKGRIEPTYMKMPEIKLPPPLAVETNNLLNKSIQEHSNTNMKLEVLISQIEESRKENVENFSGTTTQNATMIKISKWTLGATIATLIVAAVTLIATVKLSTSNNGAAPVTPATSLPAADSAPKGVNQTVDSRAPQLKQNASVAVSPAASLPVADSAPKGVNQTVDSSAPQLKQNASAAVSPAASLPVAVSAPKGVNQTTDKSSSANGAKSEP